VCGQIIFVAKHDRQTAPRRITCDARTIDATADDQQITVKRCGGIHSRGASRNKVQRQVGTDFP
jgi:hypothetical protein